MKAKLLESSDFIEDAIKEVKLAKDRVVLIAMVISNGELTQEFLGSIREASKRGVKVRMAADYITFIELGGFLVPTNKFSKSSKQINAAVADLRSAGVEFTWLGVNNWFVASGRSHCKWLIIDSIVYSFGGVNVYDFGIKNTDFMLKINSKKVSDDLSVEFSKILKADKNKMSPSNKFIKIDSENTIIIDGGFVNNSAIYRRAYKLAKQASKIIIVSQYPTTGRLGTLIKNRKRAGIDIRTYFNLPKNAGSSNKLIILLGLLFNKQTSEYKKNKYLHAKFILFEFHDGKKAVLTGSHNFTAIGGFLGTREIALESYDIKLIDQIENFFIKNVQ